MKTLSVDVRVKLLLFVVTCMFTISCTQRTLNLLLGSFIALLLFFSGKYGFAVKSWVLFLAGLYGAGIVGAHLYGAPAILCFAGCALLRILLPIMMSFTLVFQTTAVSQFIAAFQKMNIPVKIIIPFAVMFRFIPTVQEEWVGIRQAMAFRGIALHAGGILRHPMESVEHILIPLLFGAVSTMEELAAASLARGLDSDRERTCLAEVKMTWTDWLFLAVVLGFAVICLMNYSG